METFKNLAQPRWQAAIAAILIFLLLGWVWMR